MAAMAVRRARGVCAMLVAYMESVCSEHHLLLNVDAVTANVNLDLRGSFPLH